MTQVSVQNNKYHKISSDIKMFQVELLHLQFVDLEGILKHVTITVDKLDDALEGKIMFDGSSIQGFSPINQSDLFLMPDIDTFSVIPWSIEEGYAEARLLCSVLNPDSTPFEGDPRCLLEYEELFVWLLDRNLIQLDTVSCQFHAFVYQGEHTDSRCTIDSFFPFEKKAYPTISWFISAINITLFSNLCFIASFE